jgi:hypothetical protein
MTNALFNDNRFKLGVFGLNVLTSVEYPYALRIDNALLKW